MVKAKKQPDVSQTDAEVATPEVAPQLSDEKPKETPKPTTGQGPTRYETPSGFTIEDY